MTLFRHNCTRDFLVLWKGFHFSVAEFSNPLWPSELSLAQDSAQRSRKRQGFNHCTDGLKPLNSFWPKFCANYFSSHYLKESLAKIMANVQKSFRLQFSRRGQSQTLSRDAPTPVKRRQLSYIRVRQQNLQRNAAELQNVTNISMWKMLSVLLWKT